MTGAEPAGEPGRAGPAGRVREWPFATVLLVMLAGLLVTSRGYFRVGSIVVAASILLAAVLRALLPERRAGLLVVRHRVMDVAFMTAVGIGIVILAIVVPGGS